MSQPLLIPTGKAPTSVLQYGAGQDSEAILNLCAEDAAFRREYVRGRLLVICSDTGDEYQEAARTIENARELCRQRDFEFVHLTPDLGFHSQAWQSLYGQWDRNSTVGSVAYPATCSHQLKLVPSYKYLNDFLSRTYGYAPRNTKTTKAALYAYAAEYGRIDVMIGFSAGEEHRRKETSEPYIRDTVRLRYPLIDRGLTRAGCQAVTAALGFDAVMPSNCRSCHFASALDLARLHRREPEAFERWAHAEHRKLTHPKREGTRNHTVMADDRTLREHLDIALTKFSDLSDEEIEARRFSRGHQNKNKF